MRYIHLLIIIGVIYTSVQIEIKGQSAPSPGKIAAGYTYKGIVVDSIDNEPIVNAYVLATSESDTLQTATNPDGLFFIKSDHPFTSIKIMMIGYSIAHIDVPQDKASCDFGYIKMNSKAYQLDEVVVEAHIKKMVYRGDTIQFNANAFKVNKWASAGELLSKMPGMNVNKKDGTVQFNGKAVSVIYVNGKKIFGDDMYSLLAYLDAKDVKTVDAYEELNDEDQHLGTRAGQKRWVLNFNTFSKLIGMMVGHAQASFGRDEQLNMEGEHQNRHSLGTSLNFFTESKNLSLDAFSNDVDRTTNKLEEITALSQLQPGYNKIGAFRAKGHLSKKSWVIGTSYSYERRDNNRITRTQRIYPSAETFNSRVLSGTSNAYDTIHAHNLSVYGQIKPKNLFLSYSIDNSVRKDAKHNRLSNSNVNGDQLISEMSNQRTVEKTGFSGRYGISGRYQLKPKLSTGLTANLQINNSDAQSMLVDTILQNIVYSFEDIHSDENNKNTEIRVSPSLTYSHSPRLSFSGRLAMNRNHSLIRNIAIDRYTNTIDSTQSYHYKDDSKSLQPVIGVDYEGGKFRLSASLSWDLTWQSQNDVEKLAYTISDKLFHAPLLDIVYHMKDIVKNTDLSTLSVVYKNSMHVPGSNMLRPIINNTDPLYLRGGNPDLKQTYVHRFASTLNWMKDDNVANILLSVIYTRNQLDANRTVFFDSTTVLHEYNNFVAQAGSSLSTYGNIKNQYQLHTSFNYDAPIESIYSILKTKISYTYNYNPRYMDNEIIKSYSHTPLCEIKLESNLSDHVDLKIASTSSYTQMNRRNLQRNRIFNQSLETEINSFFFDDKLSVSLFCNNKFIRNIDYKDANLSVHILNFNIGYKFLPKQNAEISLSAYDLFNKNVSYTSKAYPEYLSNTWSQIAGRYFMVNFIYRFKTKIKEKTPPGGYESIIN